MSNRNNLLPSINLWSNPDFKGNASFVNLSVSGTATLDTLIVGDAAALPEGTTIDGSNPNLVTFGGDVPTIQTNGTVAYFAVPRSGTIISITAVPQAAITGADGTLTAALNGTGITGGVVTMALIGTAAGKVYRATPTGLNIVSENDIVRITVGGGNTAATSARVTFLLSY